MNDYRRRAMTSDPAKLRKCEPGAVVGAEFRFPDAREDHLHRSGHLGAADRRRERARRRGDHVGHAVDPLVERQRRVTWPVGQIHDGERYPPARTHA
jgi:hypothetical protein